MHDSDWLRYQPYISQLEQEGIVSRTFRRLDPERQEAVFTAILEEAVKNGPTTLRIKEIARRARVSVGSLYQYFPNRDGLLDFAIELSGRATAALFLECKPLLASLPLREALNAYLAGGLEWGKTAAAMVRFFCRAAYQGDPALRGRVVLPIASLMRATMEEILSQARARGEIRADVDLPAAARVINALVIAAGDSQLLPYLNSYYQLTDEDVDGTRISEALFHLVTRGIGGGR